MTLSTSQRLTFEAIFLSLSLYSFFLNSMYFIHYVEDIFILKVRLACFLFIAQFYLIQTTGSGFHIFHCVNKICLPSCLAWESAISLWFWPYLTVGYLYHICFLPQIHWRHCLAHFPLRNRGESYAFK